MRQQTENRRIKARLAGLESRARHFEEKLAAMKESLARLERGIALVDCRSHVSMVDIALVSRRLEDLEER